MDLNNIYKDDNKTVQQSIEVKEEQKIEIVEHSIECGSKVFSSANANICEDSTKGHFYPISDQVPTTGSDLYLFSSDKEERGTSSFKYEEVDNVNRIKEELIEERGSFIVPVYSDNYENFEDTIDKCSLHNISELTEVKPHALFFEEPRADVSCEICYNNTKAESNEMEAASLSPNEAEKYNQQPSTGSEVKVQFNTRHRETSFSHQNDGMISSSRRKQKATNSSSNSFSSLGIETKSNSITELYQCQLCEKQFLTHSKLKKHIRTHTQKKPFQCKICGYKCAYNSSFETHMRTHIGEKPYRCEICECKFARASNLKRHMATHTGEKPHECELCGYRCAYRCSLTKHAATHTGEKPYKCDICRFKCAEKIQLESHMATHTGEKPYECNICGFKSAHKSSWMIHLSTHTGSQAIECELCSYKCSHRGRFTMHMRTHTNEKPFECKICEYKCSQKVNFRRHMATHTGEKTFKCELCGHKSARKGSLIIHLRTHTGEKPYQCELCGYRFAHNRLRSHMKTHRKKKAF